MTHPPITPVVVGLDIEPDERQIGRTPPAWAGLEPTHELFERWRATFEDVTGAPVAFSWFWRTDPQIELAHGDPTWALREFEELLASTTQKGDAHGVHPHLWRWEGETWIQDNVDPRWTDHCVASSVAAFTDVAGYRPQIARMGDRGLDSIAYRALRRNRIRIDLSVEPGHAPLGVDAKLPSPDFSSAPTRPYRPRRGDTARAARVRRGPVVLPLSAVETDSGPHSVSYWADGPETLGRALDQGAPYAAFIGRSSIAVRPELLTGFVAQLEVLASHPRAPTMRFVTPTQALAILRRRSPLGNFRPLR